MFVGRVEKSLAETLHLEKGSLRFSGRLEYYTKRLKRLSRHLRSPLFVVVLRIVRNPINPLTNGIQGRAVGCRRVFFPLKLSRGVTKHLHEPTTRNPEMIAATRTTTVHARDIH